MDFAGRFGRQIFKLYEKYPLSLNTIVGGTVYVGGELVTQVGNHTRHRDKALNKYSAIDVFHFWKEECEYHAHHLDWERLAGVGVLGSIENGVFMLTW